MRPLCSIQPQLRQQISLPSDIVREHAACDPIKQQQLDWFKERNVAPLTILRDAFDGFSEIKVAKVSFNSRSFEFQRHRPDRRCWTAFVFLARDYTGELVDLVAWNVGFPLASWLGRVSVLGEEACFGPRMEDGLAVHRDPLAWLRGRRRGVVIVDPHRAAPLLREAAPLEAADIEHGHELQKLLAVPLPRILVPESCASPVEVKTEEVAA